MLAGLWSIAGVALSALHIQVQYVLLQCQIIVQAHD